MHYGDPRMLQPGRDSGFAPEPFSQLGICKMLPEHLYGYWPAEVFVNPAPHFTHAPVTQQRLQDVPSGELEPSLHAGLQSDSNDAIIRAWVSLCSGVPALAL